MSNKMIKFTTLSLCVASFLCAHEVENTHEGTTGHKHFEVTVTANKTEESLKNVPQSITVIDEEMLEEKGIKSVQDVISQIPNMTGLENSMGTGVNFRGLNVSDFTENNPVVVYIDGVASTSQVSFDVALANALRVEVLRGPQGTMYGKNAIGAVINIVTKEPNDNFSGNVGLEYASKNTLEGQFNISGPVLKDKLLFGLYGFGKRSDGWVKNTYHNDDKAGKYDKKRVGGYLLAHLNDDLSIKLDLAHEDKNEHKPLELGLPALEPVKNFTIKKARTQAFDVSPKADITTNSVALDVGYDLKNYKINSISTYKKMTNERLIDSDYGANPMYNDLVLERLQKTKEFTQELRIKNKDEKIKWVGGVYFDTVDDRHSPNYMQIPRPKDPTNPAAGFVNMTTQSDTKQKHKTFAVFGQAKFSIVTNLDLTLGTRLQKLKKEIDSKFYIYPVGMPLPNQPMNHLDTQKTWNAILPKVALSYKINDNFMPFLSVSKGYMPGGFNYFAMQGGAKENTFEPQTSTNYELGIKGAYNDLSFTASIFRMDIKDTHIFKIVGNSWHTDNAKKSHAQGVEFDFSYLPTNELEISGAFGYMDAKYDDHDSGSVKLNGERIHATPQYSANLGIAYYHPSGIYGRIDTRAIGKTSYYGGGIQKMVEIDPTFFADVKLGYKVGDFDIYTYVKNITEEERIIAYLNRGDVAMATFNDPRTFGLGVKYSF